MAAWLCRFRHPHQRTLRPWRWELLLDGRAL